MGRRIIMSEYPVMDDRLFRICFQTVEYFAALLVAAFWILVFSGSSWGNIPLR